jgi:hypothetical protein
VEFASHDVAEIVAETMDGYLIHPHTTVCKAVEVDEKVWRGTDKVFKKIPWVRINREKVEANRTEEGWESLVKRDEERSWERAEKIKALGIDYEALVRAEKRKAEVLAQGVDTKGDMRKLSRGRLGSASKGKSKTNS